MVLEHYASYTFYILLLLHDFKWPPVIPLYVFPEVHLAHLLLVDIRVFTFLELFTALSSAPRAPNKPSNNMWKKYWLNEWGIKIGEKLAVLRGGLEMIFVTLNTMRDTQRSGSGMLQDVNSKLWLRYQDRVDSKAHFEIALWVFSWLDTICTLRLWVSSCEDSEIICHDFFRDGCTFHHPLVVVLEGKINCGHYDPTVVSSSSKISLSSSR